MDNQILTAEDVKGQVLTFRPYVEQEETTEDTTESATTDTTQQSAEAQTDQSTEATETTVAATTTEIATPTTEPTPLEIKYAEPLKPVDPYENIKVEDVVKRFGKEELLKAFGYNDYLLNAIKYAEATGDLSEYAAVKSVDYTKLNDEQIVQRGLREKYAALGLSGEDLDEVVKADLDELKVRLKIDSESGFSESELKIGRLKLKAEAAPYREQFIRKQQEFKAPERTAVVDDQPSAEEIATEQRAQAEAFRQSVINQPEVKDFLTKKILNLEGYNYEVENPQDTVAVLYDSNRYLFHTSKKNEQGQIITDANGEPVRDWAALQEVAALLTNRTKFKQALINHGKTLGTKEVIDEAENVTDNSSKGIHATPETFWQAFRNTAKQV